MKGEAPKGFIRVHNVLKMVDKKQMFLIFGDGMIQRLMANSESEADEWVHALRKVIMLYRKRRVMYRPHSLLYPRHVTHLFISDYCQHSLQTPYTFSTLPPNTEPPMHLSSPLDVVPTLPFLLSLDMQFFDSDSESTCSSSDGDSDSESSKITIVRYQPES